MNTWIPLLFVSALAFTLDCPWIGTTAALVALPIFITFWVKIGMEIKK